MIRIFAFVVALICAAPAIAQPLPANLDKQNAIERPEDQRHYATEGLKVDAPSRSRTRT